MDRDSNNKLPPLTIYLQRVFQVQWSDSQHIVFLIMLQVSSTSWHRVQEKAASARELGRGEDGVFGF